MQRSSRCADGRTVILTTHYIEEAQQLCGRVAIIDRGVIVATGSPRELIANAKAPPRVAFRAARAVEEGVLASLAGVLSVEAADGVWRLATRTIGPTVIALVRLLESQQNDLLDLEVHHPTLEDVFIELTGSAIEGRDGEGSELTVLRSSPGDGMAAVEVSVSR